MAAIDHLNYQILGGIAAPHLRKPMLKRHHHTGEAALEYIIVGAIVVAVLGAALYAVAQSIAVKLDAINADIGS